MIPGKPRRISQRPIPGNRKTAGVGYVAIPKDVDRDNFVEACCRDGVIAIQTDFGEFLNNIRIDKTAIQNIDFPADSKSLGSLVVWINLPPMNMPTVIGVLMNDDEFLNIVEGQFMLAKESESNYVEISGDAKQAVILLKVLGQTSGGILDINVQNHNKEAKINVKVDGEFNLIAGTKVNLAAAEKISLLIKNPIDDKSTETVIEYNRKDGFSYKDEFGNEVTLKDKQFTVKTPKTNMGDGSYSMKDLFYDIIDEVSKSTVQTQMGIQPLLNKVQITKLKDKVDKILN